MRQGEVGHKLYKIGTLTFVVSACSNVRKFWRTIFSDNVSLLGKLREAYLTANNLCAAPSKIGCKVQPCDSCLYSWSFLGFDMTFSFWASLQALTAWY